MNTAPLNDLWVDAVRKADHLCPSDLSTPDKWRWKANYLRYALAAPQPPVAVGVEAERLIGLAASLRFKRDCPLCKETFEDHDCTSAAELLEQIAATPSEAAPAGQSQGWATAVQKAQRDALAVFKDSCNHTQDAIEYMKAHMLAATPSEATSDRPELTVWYGAMPESNGKSNFTAVLMRKDASWLDGMTDGITIDCSEYPDRVRYEADRVRYLIGEIADEPDILAYDPDKHSGFARWSVAADVLKLLKDARWRIANLVGPNGAQGLDRDVIDRIDAYISAPSEAAPADPMDWPLPCDVTVGAGTIKKGCKLRTLVARMEVLHSMAKGEAAPAGQGATDEQVLNAVMAFTQAGKRGLDLRGAIKCAIEAAQPTKDE